MNTLDGEEPKPARAHQFQQDRFGLRSYAIFANFDASIDALARMAMAESWDYRFTVSDKRHPILVSYLFHTFYKVHKEKKIREEGRYSVFDTGLVTDRQEEIYALFQRNLNDKSKIKWFFLEFKKRSDRVLMGFSSLPERANYFEDPAYLIYDPRLDIRVNFDHIISDNKHRFPAPFNAMADHQLTMFLSGALDDTIRRIKRCYKTAIPQYFNNNIQLLLPLCLSDKNKADLALVVERDNNIYRAATCITLDMAINNARLITKPDDEWLKP